MAVEWEPVLIVLIIMMTIFGLSFLIYQHQVDESSYEKCIDHCTDNIMDDVLEMTCIRECLPLDKCDAYQKGDEQ